MIPSHNHHVRNLPKKKKQKKNWKEKQRERQIKQQRAQEAYETQKERRAQTKPRRYPKGKIFFGICLIGLICTALVAWQYSSKQATSNPPLTGLAPNFALNDINGNPFSLNQHAGEVIAIHFMAVSCGGGIVQTNENQLRSLKSVCSNYCGEKSVTIVTVAATTCAKSCLETIRTDYGVTWTLGNDYDDGKGDIINAYSSYSIADGAIVLIDKDFRVANVYSQETTFETLAARINQLLQA